MKVRLESLRNDERNGKVRKGGRNERRKRSQDARSGEKVQLRQQSRQKSRERYFSKNTEDL